MKYHEIKKWSWNYVICIMKLGKTIMKWRDTSWKCLQRDWTFYASIKHSSSGCGSKLHELKYGLSKHIFTLEMSTYGHYVSLRGSRPGTLGNPAQVRVRVRASVWKTCVSFGECLCFCEIQVWSGKTWYESVRTWRKKTKNKTRSATGPCGEVLRENTWTCAGVRACTWRHSGQEQRRGEWGVQRFSVKKTSKTVCAGFYCSSSQKSIKCSTFPVGTFPWQHIIL